MEKSAPGVKRLNLELGCKSPHVVLDDDAIRIANDSGYGLAGAVTSASEERALGVAARMRTGAIAVNASPSTVASRRVPRHRSAVGRPAAAA